MLFISPPFGTYIRSPRFKYVLGSFTLQPRDGLYLQVLKTFRYSFKYKGWINRIGLYNPGIRYAVQKYYNIEQSPAIPNNDIYSIAVQHPDEISTIVNLLPDTTFAIFQNPCPAQLRW